MVRMESRKKHATLASVHSWDYARSLYNESVMVSTPDGFISKTGGMTKREDKAMRFDGPGEAIRMAQVYGYAVIAW
jgi:hypothetical protein